MYFAFLAEFVLMLLLTYVKPLNIGLGTRDNIFIHFGTCGCAFMPMIMIWNEIRKYLVDIYLKFIFNRFEITHHLNRTCQIGGPDMLYIEKKYSKYNY